MEDDDFDEFVDEVNIYERTVFDSIDKFSPDDKKMKFRKYADAIARNLREQGVVRISDSEIGGIIKMAEHVPHSEYKNPTAFVLGYYVTKKGNIDKTTFGRVKSSFKFFDVNGTMKESDVLRYSNLWLNMT
jgi:hypothetical protein